MCPRSCCVVPCGGAAFRRWHTNFCHGIGAEQANVRRAAGDVEEEAAPAGVIHSTTMALLLLLLLRHALPPLLYNNMEEARGGKAPSRDCAPLTAGSGEAITVEYMSALALALASILLSDVPLNLGRMSRAQNAHIVRSSLLGTNWAAVH
ncbi:hypothetical protein GPALN_014447 [Globodera pallida]|nr:hypothetical protein GPALN_014447 [Globodera pallida]